MIGLDPTHDEFKTNQIVNWITWTILFGGAVKTIMKIKKMGLQDVLCIQVVFKKGAFDTHNVYFSVHAPNVKKNQQIIKFDNF